VKEKNNMTNRPTPTPSEGNPFHRHLYSMRRDSDTDPPTVGLLILAEWRPGRFVPAFRAYPIGWMEVRADGALISACEPLTWAELPRPARTADLLAALGLDEDDWQAIADLTEAEADSSRWVEGGIDPWAEGLDRRVRAVLARLEGEGG
jgi:hypothetical protein